MKRKPVVLAATARKISENQSRFTRFHIHSVVQKLTGIFKTAKNHCLQPLVTYKQHAYFSLCGLLNFALPVFKNFSQNSTKHGLAYQSFLLYFYLDFNNLPFLLMSGCH